MSERTGAVHIRKAALARLEGKVMREGGEVRYLTGADVGLVTSVMDADVAPGSGAARHRHPYGEIFVLHDGRGRYEVEGASVDAEAGDMVIIPPHSWHSFVNTGSETLRHTAVHESPRVDTTFEDGSRR